MPRSEQPSFSPRAVGGRRFVAFFHPSYPDTAPPLVTLAAVDYVHEGAEVIKGIDYDTAKTACGIIACNRYDDAACFALKSKGGRWHRFDRPADGLLRASSDFTFYFIVDTPTFCYPVVPSFDHWRFPQTLPPRWASLSVAGHGDYDDACEPSCFKETDCARVAPFSHTSWYDSNLMEKFCQRHGAGRMSVSRLFADIRRCFPENRMDLIPRGQHPSRFELHPKLLLQGIMDTVIHCRQLSGHDSHSLIRFSGITREHLFACFAFHILSDANYRFLGGALKYTVRLFNPEKAEEYADELYSDDIAELSCIFPSPMKTTASRCPESDDHYDSDNFDEDGDCSYSQEASSENRIGRRRHRSPSYHLNWQHREHSQQDWDNDNDAGSLQYRTRSYHASSIGVPSLSSTLSTSSVDTRQTGRTPENVADSNAKPSLFTAVICSKRPYHDYSEAPAASPSPKRHCLRSYNRTRP